VTAKKKKKDLKKKKDKKKDIRWNYCPFIFLLNNCPTLAGCQNGAKNFFFK
jgi:hypothetical protein